MENCKVLQRIQRMWHCSALASKGFSTMGFSLLIEEPAANEIINILSFVNGWKFFREIFRNEVLKSKIGYQNVPWLPKWDENYFYRGNHYVHANPLAISVEWERRDKIIYILLSIQISEYQIVKTVKKVWHTRKNCRCDIDAYS